MLVERQPIYLVLKVVTPANIHLFDQEPLEGGAVECQPAGDI